MLDGMERLVAALSATPGLVASENPYVEGPEWLVSLEPDRDETDRPTVEAWTSLMVLAYGAQSWMNGVRFEILASPPMLNPIPDSWCLIGTADPEVVATAVDKLNLVPYDEWALDEMLGELDDTPDEPA